MVEKDVDLFALASAVQVDKDCPAVGFFVFAEEGVDLIAALFEALYLIQGNRVVHTGFPITGGKEFIVPDAIHGVLNDDVYFGALR